MRRGAKLYNVILPLWLLWLFPQTWFLVLPATFLTDLAISAAAMRFAGVTGIGKALKVSILRTWLCGFAADCAGTALLLLPLIVSAAMPDLTRIERLANSLTANPFADRCALLWAAAAVALSAFLICTLNRGFCLRRTELTDRQRRRVSIALALFTAPWFFLCPSPYF